MLGPVLVAFGNEAQKKKFLPRIANLDDWWCQGFSEPGSGSDLASLKTSAKLVDGHYVVNGQKTWTTLAQYADWIFCLVRTDPAAAKKQEGISFLMIDMKTPGITVRPIQTIDGASEVNEVFFDDVKVPAENLVGQENKGWDYAKFLLGNERTGIARIGASKARIRRLKELAALEQAGGKPLMADERFRAKITAVEVELKALEMTELRVVAARTKQQQARSGLVHSQDQGLGDSADHHRVAARSRRSLRPARSDRSRRERAMERAADRPRLGRSARPAIFQHPQDDDLRRLERNSEEHHRQGDFGIVMTSSSLRSGATSNPVTAHRLDCFVATLLAMTRKGSELTNGFRADRRAADIAA